MELAGRLELLVIALVPFVFCLYAIFWMREMRGVINEINTRLRQQMEQSQRQQKELVKTEASQDSPAEAERIKLPPIKR